MCAAQGAAAIEDRSTLFERFGHGDACSGAGDDGEGFRKHHGARARVRGVLHEALGAQQVRRHVCGRAHLDETDSAHQVAGWCSPGRSAGACSEAGASFEVTASSARRAARAA